MSYAYDAADRLLSATYGTATATTLTYDLAGRKTGMTDADMGTWGYTYNALGSLATQTDARECTTTLAYDELNRLTGKSYGQGCPTTTAVSYTYDQGINGIGRRTRMDDGSGHTTWLYDERGRTISETKVISDTGTFLTLWSFNSADQLVEMTYPGGSAGQAGEVLSYSYHPQGALKNFYSQANSYYYLQNASYDAAGRMDLLNLGAADLVSNPVLLRDYSFFAWDAANGLCRLMRLKTGTPANPTSLQDLRYYTGSEGSPTSAYDPVGNILNIFDYKAGNPQTQSFGYDVVNQKTKSLRIRIPKCPLNRKENVL